MMFNDSPVLRVRKGDEDDVDILADILRPSLREDDFTTEKEVIINEIGMYDDRPMYAAYDQAKQLYFADHPLAHRRTLLRVVGMEAASDDEGSFSSKRQGRFAPHGPAGTGDYGNLSSKSV